MLGERVKWENSIRIVRHGFLLMLLLWGTVETGYGQTMQRVYATDESHGGILHSVDKPSLAVDGNVSTHSTLSFALLGSVWQRLQFPSTLQANTTVRVKIGTSTSLLGLLENIKIQAYNNTNAIGGAVSLNTLISLVGGEDQAEIVFTPSSAFNSVRIRSSGIDLGGGLKIYEAYYLTPASGGSNCDTPADILYGSTSGIVGGLNAVQNPDDAIDGNPDTYATISSNVGIANETHLTALYNNPSQVGDSIRIILRRPDGLLDLNVLSQTVKISTMLDDVDHGEFQPELLSLRLLSSSSDIFEVVVPTTIPYNRIKVSIPGLAHVLSRLEVFEIQRKLAKPTLTASSMTNNELTVCEGETVTVNVNNPISGSNYLWYTSQSGSTAIHTGTSYTITPSDPGEISLYVGRNINGCTEESERTVIKINVLPLPGKPHLTISDVIN